MHPRLCLASLPLLAACGPRAPATEPASTRQHALLLQQAFFRVPGGTPQHYEMSSTVMPPGAHPACPSGRLFVGHGGGLARQLRVELPCALRPGSEGCGAPVDEALQPPDWSIPAASRCTPDQGCTCTTERTHPQFTRAGTDTSYARNGPFLFRVYSGNEHQPEPNTCKARFTNFVNIVQRSGDCGQSWTSTILNVNTLPSRPRLCAGLDMPWIHVDPFDRVGPDQGALYLLGGAGSNCEGGVSATGLFRSLDGGETWQPSHVFQDGGNALISNTGITSTPGGTLVVFGCRYNPRINENNRALMIYYSHDQGATFELLKVTSGTPLCGILSSNPSQENSNFLPGHVYANSTPITSVSFAGEAGNSEVVRLAYSSLEPAEGPWRRQVVQLAEALLPKRGYRQAPAFRPLGQLRPANASDSIFRASFVEADTTVNQKPVGSSVLWWQEVNAATGLHSVFYQLLWSSAAPSPAAPLSPGPRGEPVSWPIKAPCSQRNGVHCWAGDFDRGTFFHDPTSRTNNFLLFWSQSHPDIEGHNAFLHYNIISVPSSP
jgi:hypothetical protein